MTVQPDETFFVDHEPPDSRIDLSLRVRLGIAMAVSAGIDICYIVEDDDYYPADYFEKMNMEGLDFIGSNKTIYYNPLTASYQELSHSYRSSLCFTGFRISALQKFRWPPEDTVFLDVILWRYAMDYRYKLFDEPVGVGIKGHGKGKAAGIGHRMDLRVKDPNYQFLKSQVDKEAYAFYRSL